jgi:hypothetical protein
MTTTPRIQPNGTWHYGPAVVSGIRDTVTAETAEGLVSLVFSLSRGRATFVGLQRVRRDNDANVIEHMTSECLPTATWVRIYRADQRRRSVIR